MIDRFARGPGCALSRARGAFVRPCVCEGAGARAHRGACEQGPVCGVRGAAAGESCSDRPRRSDSGRTAPAGIRGAAVTGLIRARWLSGTVSLGGLGNHRPPARSAAAAARAGGSTVTWRQWRAVRSGRHAAVRGRTAGPALPGVTVPVTASAAADEPRPDPVRGLGYCRWWAAQR